MAHDVSVIIPVYNTPAAYLREAIDSVLGQSVSPVEVIVVDDGSTPDLGWLVSLYGDRLMYVRQPNRGPAAARNTGLKLATGSLVAFLDADDVWESDKLEAQLHLIKQRPALGLVYAPVIRINADGEPLVGLRTNPKHDGKVFEQLFMRNFIPISTVLIRRRCFEDVGYFNEAFKLSEDYELLLRVTHRYEVAFVDRPLAQYRIHEGSISRNLDPFYLSERDVIEKAVREFGTAHPQLPALRRQRLGQLFFEYGYDLFATKSYTQARQQFLQSLRYAPLNVRALAYYVATFSSIAIRSIRRARGIARP